MQNSFESSHQRRRPVDDLQWKAVAETDQQHKFLTTKSTNDNAPRAMYLPAIGTAFKSVFRKRGRVSDCSSTGSQENASSNKNKQKKKKMRGSPRVETMVLTTPLDIERAMSAVTLPKRVDIQANLIAKSKGASLAALLKRVGCLELCIQGKSATAPRRVFEHEVIAAISHVKQHKLQKLILKNLDIQRLEHHGEEDERLQKRLTKLENLQELHVQSCRLDAVFQDVLESTQELPHLKEVTINLNDALRGKPQKALLIETMTSLLQRPQITSLALSEYPQDIRFWGAVAASRTLTHLGLAYRAGDSTLQTYWDLLQQNTSIDQLELQVETGTPLTPVMELLKRNTTITSLLLHLEQDPTLVKQQLTEVLEYQNFTLQKISLLAYNIYGYKVRIPCPQLDFYTKLNRQGRCHLFGVKPHDVEFIGAMATNTYDVSSTFYWLRSNPSLCHH